MKKASKEVVKRRPIAVKWTPSQLQLVNNIRAKLMERGSNVKFSEIVRHSTFIGLREIVNCLEDLPAQEKDKILNQLDSTIRETELKKVVLKV